MARSTLILIAAFAFFTARVRCEFTLEVNLLNYTNPSGLCAECNTRLDQVTNATQLVPVCCDDEPISAGNCDNTGEERCDTRFRWTVRSFGTSLETRPVSVPNADRPPYFFTDCTRSPSTCPFSEISTTFSQGPTAFLGVTENPLNIESTTGWTGRIQFFIEALDGGLPNIIDSLLVNLNNLQLGGDFTEEIMFTGFHNIATMTMSFRVYCSLGFCGPDCTTTSTNNPRIAECHSNGFLTCINNRLNPEDSCQKCFNNLLDITTSCSTCIDPNYSPESGCETCAQENYDMEENCAVCKFGYDLESNCTQCTSNRDLSTNCITCIPEWDIDSDCMSCMPYRDPDTNCTQCLPNRDPFTDCTQCLPGWDIDSDCTQCLPNKDPATNCTLCLQSDRFTDSDCGVCVQPGADPETLCETCLMPGTELSSNCACKENYDLSTKCSTCLSGWDSSYDCRVCLTGRNISTNCTTCIPGYSGPDCTLTIVRVSAPSNTLLLNVIYGTVIGILLFVTLILGLMVALLVCCYKRDGNYISEDYEMGKNIRITDPLATNIGSGIEASEELNTSHRGVKKSQMIEE